MKVKELINELQRLDPEFDVVIPGYAGSVDDIANIEVVSLRRDVNTAWYYGRHEVNRSQPASVVLIN